MEIWLIGKQYLSVDFKPQRRSQSLDSGRTEEAAGGATVIHNHMPIVSGPLAYGDIDEIKVLPQADYAVTVKKRKTLYLVVNREKD